MNEVFTTTSWPPSVEIKLLGLGIQRVGNGYIVTKRAVPWDGVSVTAVLIAKSPMDLADIVQEWAQAIEQEPKSPVKS